MADISSAFGSPFSNSCALTFDVAPVFASTVFGDTAPKWMGFVTIHSLVGQLQEYRYEVFSTEPQGFRASLFPVSGRGNSVKNTFYQVDQPAEKIVTRGTITNSNNMTFTFPITSPKIDYFVLVSPIFHPTTVPLPSFSQESLRNIELKVPNKNGASDERTQEFGIFYTSKLIKKRNETVRDLKASKPSATDTALSPGRACQGRDIRPANEKDELSKWPIAEPVGSNHFFEVPEFASPSEFADGMATETKDVFVKNFLKPQKA